MRTLALLALSLVLALVMLPMSASADTVDTPAPTACGPDAPERAAQPSQPGDRAATLAITGMSCGSCAEGIRAVLSNVAGVRSASVSFEKENALVIYDPKSTTIADLVRAVEKEGYGAKKVDDKNA